MATLREKAYELTKGKCFYCGCKIYFDDFQMDHFIAKSRGGTGGKNYVASCRDCNMCKSNLSIEEFRQKLEKSIYKNNQARMITKFYGVKPKKIIFYFEKEGIQNGRC